MPKRRMSDSTADDVSLEKALSRSVGRSGDAGAMRSVDGVLSPTTAPAPPPGMSPTSGPENTASPSRRPAPRRSTRSEIGVTDQPPETVSSRKVRRADASPPDLADAMRPSAPPLTQVGGVDQRATAQSQQMKNERDASRPAQNINQLARSTPPSAARKHRPERSSTPPSVRSAVARRFATSRTPLGPLSGRLGTVDNLAADDVPAMSRANTVGGSVRAPQEARSANQPTSGHSGSLQTAPPATVSRRVTTSSTERDVDTALRSVGRGGHRAPTSVVPNGMGSIAGRTAASSAPSVAAQISAQRMASVLPKSRLAPTVPMTSLAVAAPKAARAVSPGEITDLVRRAVDERLAQTSQAQPARIEKYSRTPSMPAVAAVPAVASVRRTADESIAPVDAGTDTSTTAQLDNFDRIAEAVERRILEQLERRFGRTGGW